MSSTTTSESLAISEATAVGLTSSVAGETDADSVATDHEPKHNRNRAVVKP